MALIARKTNTSSENSYCYDVFRFLMARNGLAIEFCCILRFIENLVESSEWRKQAYFQLWTER